MVRLTSWIAGGVALVALVAGLCVLPTQGQVIVGGGPEGGATFILEEGGGVYPLVFQLRDDGAWGEAKTQLVERAGAGDRVEVVYALTQARRHQDEKVQARFDAVLKALEEAGHYPLTADHQKEQVKALTALLRKVEKGRPAAEVTPAVMMALVRAQRELEQAQQMIETGKEPEPQGMAPGVGGIIIGGGSGGGAQE